ncbi:MAG: AAA family ATPase [Brevibacterium aurantiacum]|uniref:ATPase n=1 Tax=Brevibacterium aurantiacum TaxID=273384 RepID=A0A3T0DFB5_BREAU|nr:MULTISPECIES: zeta toxin family protein [Brevibacterium]AZT93941.1 ATPase [Brevibacterium aurantiacum]MDN5658734.1 zeta toxin family protein [Brevibacterium sandarakinum]
MPVLHLLAGPNGAGKSSYVHDVLAPVTHLPFINADVIAAQRWPDTQLEHAYEAARIAERLRREFIAEKRSFISETVFSHPSKVQLVTDAADAGFLVTLHIVMVPVDLTVQRVRERVRRGGHAVPEHKIRERYERLWEHVAETIGTADSANLYDNSSARRPFHLCASFELGALVGSPDWPTWVPDPLKRLGE